jgi:hypothetical protein
MEKSKSNHIGNSIQPAVTFGKVGIKKNSQKILQIESE